MQQLTSVVARADQLRDGTLATKDCGVVTQRVMEPATQQAAAHRCATGVQHREQGRGVFTGQRLRDLKVAARGRIHQHILAGPVCAERLHVRQRVRLRAACVPK